MLWYNYIMEPTKNTSGIFHRIASTAREFWQWLKTGCHDLKVAILTKFARWSDPKLAPYREQPSAQPKKEPDSGKPRAEAAVSAPTSKTPPAPETIAEFIAMVKRTPRSVLSSRERHVISTIMNFPNVRVSDLMLPQSAITYVRDDEVLGPLTLDRLYRSGFQHFPVLNYDRKIIGLIHTTALNNLEIKETSKAIDLLDPKVYYLREDYTLNQALAAFLRTNCYFFLVIDHYERIIGMLTYQMIIDYLLGETPTDDFDRDSDRLAVAKRK